MADLPFHLKSEEQINLNFLGGLKLQRYDYICQAGYLPSCIIHVPNGFFLQTVTLRGLFHSGEMG